MRDRPMDTKETKRVKTLVKASRELIAPDDPHCPDDLRWIMAVIEELAEKLGVTL